MTSGFILLARWFLPLVAETERYYTFFTKSELCEATEGLTTKLHSEWCTLGHEPYSLVFISNVFVVDVVTHEHDTC